MTSRPEQTGTAPRRGREPNGRARRGGAAASDARAGQRGYALVALLAVMTIIAILMTAAAPRMQQQAQRELEKESIARGEEVAAAIYQFAAEMRRLPTSMDELVNGYTPPNGTFKTVYPLRKSAARDPLATTRDGEWKLVRQGDRVFSDFVAGVAKYNGGTLPSAIIYRGFLGGQPPQLNSLIDLKKDEEEEPPGGEDNESNVSGPFIGVVSRSQRKAVLHYYGVERHDRWVFTPYFR